MAQHGKPAAIASVPVITDPLPFSPSFSANPRERAIGNGTFQLNTSVDVPAGESLVMPLHEMPSANSCIIAIEAAAGAASGAIIARLWQDGTFPTVSEGLPLKDGGVIEIQGNLNIKNTRIISADDRAHTIQVQYFS